MERIPLSRNTTWHVKIKDFDETAKVSKEVREGDVVYKISYKKVFIQNSFESPHEGGLQGHSKFYDTPHKVEEELKSRQDAINRWKLEEVKTVKCATRKKLFQLLGTTTGHLDSLYVSIFFSTFRSFTTPQLLVEQLIKNYYEYSVNPNVSEPSRSNYLKSLRQVVYVWTSKYLKDFYDPPRHNLLRTLISFFSQNSAKKLTEKLNSSLNTLYSSSIDDLTFSGFNWKLPSPINAFYDLSLLSAWQFAEQLTCIDADLFCRVYLPECLGSMWSKRLEAKKEVRSVMATVDQFNHLTYRVIASILALLHPQGRSKMIERWIEIAQELRYLKNFSSLKAVTSALRSAAIFRLDRTWALVDQKHLSIYERLTKTMSDDDNQIALREIMCQEGTSKFATVKRYRKTKSCHISKEEDLVFLNLGIVPYLGTFLTDLTMLHAAQKDFVKDEEPEPMVNFEKKSREHSILTQLSLLQTSCRLYNLNFHSEFQPLFLGMPTTTAQKSYELSCKLEPKITPTKPLQHSNSDKYHTLSSHSLSRRLSKGSTCERSFCNPLFDTAISHCWSFNSLSHKAYKTNEVRKVSTLPADEKLIDGRCLKEAIVKVYVEGVAGASHCSKYKSIVVSKMDTTEDVIANILTKYNVNDDAILFYLFQLLPDHPQLLFESGVGVLKHMRPCQCLELLVKKKHHFARQMIL